MNAHSELLEHRIGQYLFMAFAKIPQAQHDPELVTVVLYVIVEVQMPSEDLQLVCKAPALHMLHTLQSTHQEEAFRGDLPCDFQGHLCDVMCTP